MAQDSSLLIHKNHSPEWFMNSSCHKDTTFTWPAHGLLMWMPCLCDLNYSWTIPANSVHEFIMNCLGHLMFKDISCTVHELLCELFMPLCTTEPTPKSSFSDKCSWSLWSTVNSRKRMREILSWINTRHSHSVFMENIHIFRYLRFRASLPKTSCGPVVHK